MKKRFGTILIFIAILTVLTGCSINDFFDVRSAMSPPSISDEQIGVENSIRDYLGSDFKFSYIAIDDKYSSALKCNIGGLEYMMVFCETEDKLIKSHSIFFEKKGDKWVVKDDIVEGNFKIRSACIKDVNGDGLDEIVIEGARISNSKPKTYIYQIQKNGIVPVK